MTTIEAALKLAEDTVRHTDEIVLSCETARKLSDGIIEADYIFKTNPLSGGESWRKRHTEEKCKSTRPS